MTKEITPNIVQKLVKVKKITRKQLLEEKALRDQEAEKQKQLKAIPSGKTYRFDDFKNQLPELITKFDTEKTKEKKYRESIERFHRSFAKWKEKGFTMHYYFDECLCKAIGRIITPVEVHIPHRLNPMYEIEKEELYDESLFEN